MLYRSASYLSIFNTGMLFFVFLKNLNLNLGYFNIPIFILLLTGILTVGHIDIKLGLYKNEIKNANKNNEILNEILNEVKNKKI